MAATRYTITQGETGPIIRPRPSAIDTGVTLDANWICRTAVNDLDGESVIAPRVITTMTDDALYFELALTPTETESLTVASGDLSTNYVQVVEISNATLFPIFNVEEEYIIKVKKAGITNV